MIRAELVRFLLPAALSAAFMAPLDAQADGVSREEMWPAPTEDDWRKPVLIQWQRTWDDAIAVARETGKPILVCVNMDGEIASEHYAGIRYRDPEIATLYAPYVPVIASVYRHNPSDYDEAGRRILCPRFGCVTCGEHIAIEPLLYERFFDGKRIAPRHVMVELDENGGDEFAEAYDVYYAFDTQSVFDTIARGIAERTRQPRPERRTDRSLAERVRSRDSRDQTAVEAAYDAGDKDTKRALLQAAIEAGDDASVDLLRLAVFDLDVELAALAREGLVRTGRVEAADVINEALRVPLEAEERDALITALTRLGAESARAKSLSIVHRGLVARSKEIDVDGWAELLAGAEYPAPKGFETVADDLAASVEASNSRPEDPSAKLDLAEKSLVLAVDPGSAEVLAHDPSTAGKFAQLQFEDAYRAAHDAERLGAKGWRLHATIALSAWYLGKLEESYERAQRAMPEVPPGAEGWTAMATVALYAVARKKAIERKIVAKEDWPPEWLSDVASAYAILAEHPLGRPVHFADHYDFLDWLGAKGRAARVLRHGLTRFPNAAELHERLRGRLLRDRGADALESHYEQMLETDSSADLRWFAGYAMIVAAEFHRRAADPTRAVSAYDRAIALLDEFVEQAPERRETADHYAAMALGGRARIALERGDLGSALRDVLASFERYAEAAASLDGLNLSTVDTAKMLRARLDASGDAEGAARLQSALDALDPKLLELPAYERPVGQPEPRRGRRR